MSHHSQQYAERQLERYAEAVQARDALAKAYAQVREAIIPDNVRKELADADAEYGPMLQHANDLVAEREAQAKRLALVHGESVKAAGFHAVYAAGRTKWDTSALDGFAAAHPELQRFRSVGEPSVSLRRDKAASNLLVDVLAGDVKPENAPAVAFAL